MRRFLIVLAIILTPLAVVAAMIAADRTFGQPGRGYDYVVKVDLVDAANKTALPAVQGPMDASRPLVVIDAGHGGKDPGSGAGQTKEKDLTLAMALALRDELLRGGGVRVALTREDDRYLFLPERTAIARRLGADLFISIHADSTEGETDAMGATVYTLSEKGSSQVAERMAARENAADRIGGIKIEDQDGSVGAILVDLAQRETQARSERFAQLILREGQGKLPFKDRSIQAAAFAVLKSPDVPSVLFESGYINNPAELERLKSENGRLRFAQSLASAIRVFFARNLATTGGV